MSIRTKSVPRLCAFVALTAPSLAVQQGTIKDPAPPKVNELAPADLPAARGYDELTRHAAPRPLAEGAVVQDWPTFLGPERTGRSSETPLAIWDEAGPTLLWEMERGTGYGAPSVQGRRLVFHHRVDSEVHIDCLDAVTGERFWRYSHPSDYSPRYIRNAGPRTTPTIAGERVFVSGVQGGLRCLELSTGRLIWERDLAAEFGIGDGFFGIVSSPLAYGGLLIVNVGAPGPSVAAFDQATGKLVWGTGVEWGASCASPVVASMRGSDKLFVVTGGESRPATGGLMTLDPLTGALDFEFPFRSRIVESVNGSSPVVGGERVFLTAAYGVGTVGLDLGANGGCEEAWRNRSVAIEFSNPVFVDGHLYLIDGVTDRSGDLVCLEPASGKELSRTELNWDEKEAGSERVLAGGVGKGSLLHADGRFLVLGDNGHLLALEGGPQGAKIVSRTTPFWAKQSWTPLVLSHGLLYVCQNNPAHVGEASPARLLCYDLRGK